MKLDIKLAYRPLRMPIWHGDWFARSLHRGKIFGQFLGGNLEFWGHWVQKDTQTHFKSSRMILELALDIWSFMHSFTL